MSIVEEKRALRRSLRELRDGLETDDRLEWDAAIAEQVLALPEFALAAGPVSGFWPIGSEADARQILVGASGRGLATCLPAVVDGALVFRRWTPWEPIVPGGFGTLVPLPEADTVLPRTLIVPLLGFDRRGFRLGYGKGHYDRALTELASAGPILAIGIAYGCQEVEAMPIEPHDRALDIIVTERGVIRRSGV